MPSGPDPLKPGAVPPQAPIIGKSNTKAKNTTGVPDEPAFDEFVSANPVKDAQHFMGVISRVLPGLSKEAAQILAEKTAERDSGNIAQLDFWNMITISRKVVEEYYEDEWAFFVNAKTLNLLIELTCKAYHLNQPQSLSYLKEKQLTKLQNLGQIQRNKLFFAELISFSLEYDLLWRRFNLKIF